MSINNKGFISMLVISKTVVDIILGDCRCASVEQGWLLGCSQSVDIIDACLQIPATSAGKAHYTLDAAFATRTIHNWAGAGICAIGFVHSHLVDKDDLSRADRESASSMLRALQLPLLYIGVIVINNLVNAERTHLILYGAVLDENQRCTITQLPYVISEEMN